MKRLLKYRDELTKNEWFMVKRIPFENNPRIQFFDGKKR